MAAPRKGAITGCEECRALQAHEFRSADDMVHALQVAAAEMDRGVLTRVHDERLGAAEQEALASAHAAEALPGTVRYRFRCAVCGDGFELWADNGEGTGAWTREAAKPAG